MEVTKAQLALAQVRLKEWGDAFKRVKATPTGYSSQTVEQKAVYGSGGAEGDIGAAAWATEALILDLARCHREMIKLYYLFGFKGYNGGALIGASDKTYYNRLHRAEEAFVNLSHEKEKLKNSLQSVTRKPIVLCNP